MLVRSIPAVEGKTYSDVVEDFFTHYHGSTYLSHQMVYQAGKVQAMLVSELTYPPAWMSHYV